MKKASFKEFNCQCLLIEFSFMSFSKTTQSSSFSRFANFFDIFSWGWRAVFFSILLFLGFNLLFCTQPLSATKKEVVGSPVRPSSMPIPVPSQHHMFSNRQRLLDLDYQVSISPHLFIIMFPIYHKKFCYQLFCHWLKG